MTSKQLVTDFHINVLHKMYVPNVNGNWDHRSKWIIFFASYQSTNTKRYASIAHTNIRMRASIRYLYCAVESQSEDPSAAGKPAEPKRVRGTKPKVRSRQPGASKQLTYDGGDDDECSDASDEDLLTEVEMGLYERVVPLCNYRVMDRLPKSLKPSDVQFSDSDELDVATFLRSIGLSPKKARDIDDDNDGEHGDAEHGDAEQPLGCEPTGAGEYWIFERVGVRMDVRL